MEAHEHDESLTLAEIANEIDDAETAHQRIARELNSARHIFDRRVNDQSPDHPLWQMVVDEELPALTVAEDGALSRLDRMLATVTGRIAYLRTAGWRPDLFTHEQAAMVSAVPVVQAELASASSASIRESIQTAIMHSDKARMAAYASLAGIVDARQFTVAQTGTSALGASDGRWEIETLLETCRKRTADRDVQRQIDAAETLVRQVGATRADIIERRNQHAPNGQRVGNLLERYEFGTKWGGEGQKRANPYDADKLAIRAGRSG